MALHLWRLVRRVIYYVSHFLNFGKLIDRTNIMDSLDGLNVGEVYLTRAASDEELSQTESLYEASFPREERRDFVSRSSLLKQGKAQYYTIEKEGEGSIGLLHCWFLPSAFFIEHFALAPITRNHGIGGTLLNEVLDRVGKPCVLEVDPPTDDISRRRLLFYKRHGFSIVMQNYVQPPYHASDPEEFPLYLLGGGKGVAQMNVKQVLNELHGKVYQRSGLML